MSYYYKFATYPERTSIIEGVTNAASILDNKLQSFNLINLDISNYNKRYFGGHIESAETRRLNLTKYSYVLSWALAHIDSPIEELTFLDYGGGHGMLSLLAKQFGIGNVLHNDIYPESSKDAKIIGDSLSIEADDYITGDIDEVISYTKKNRINIDSMGSYDVIEHIYDIENFISKLTKLSNGSMSMFHASAANEKNLRIKRQIKSIHKNFELNDREEKIGRKPTDTTKALIQVRNDIIKDYAPDLSIDEIRKLSELTRGKIIDDIKQSVDNYINKGILPDKPEHPTNTCDPYTGNWFEHLMNPDHLISKLNQNGFEAKVLNGYYDKSNNRIKRFIKISLNSIIRILGKKGIYFAPFYALSAKRSRV